ncbi:MAG: ATP-binding protein, partial [Anaerolineae bacterium]|nr:ATP-binding protein [Anaerolineae bacterium]
MNAKTIQIENVGPIERLSIPLPEAGVVVLRGRNGCGKSHALDAVDALVTGRGRPPCRDGATKGRVAGCGVTLTIGRSQRRSGEAEVQSLEGRLDITQLVEPPIQDPEAADVRRIKALIQLSGRSATVQDFAAMIPDAAGLGLFDADEPVALAGQIKRALEAEARRYEQAAEKERVAAEVQQAQAGEWPPEAMALDVSATQAELSQALAVHA